MYLILLVLALLGHFTKGLQEFYWNSLKLPFRI